MTNAEIQALIDDAVADINAAAADAKNALATLAQARSALDPPPPPPPPVDPPKTVLPRFGGAPGFEIETLTAAALNTELDHWADIGCQILRYDLLQSAAYLATFKTILAGCEQRGMKTIACLRGTSGPYGAAAAASYAGQMAATFGTRVAVYEWVNEPNLGAASGQSRYTGAQYGAELAAAYAAIKAVDQKLLVANGGLGIWAGSGASHPSVWWPAALAGGARDHFDIGNGHAYDSVTGSQWATITSLDFQGKPLIITEAGAQSQVQATQIPEQLTDKRATTVCTFSMQEGSWAILGHPGYAAYKAVPKP